MKRNYGWIRELFRYSIASLSSTAIIIYIILSTINILFPKKNIDTINSILSQSENIQNDNKQELAILWDNENIEYYNTGLKLSSKIRDKKFSINKLTTNQLLQNGDNYNYEESNEIIKSNPFDIEKIISDLNLSKEKRVAVIAKELWVNRKEERWYYAKLAWIEWNYNWSLDQNQKVRSYLIANAQEIYKDKHWRNEWESLDLVPQKNKEVKLNAKEITWEVTYNDVTLKVTAPIESFPEWTILKIKTLEDEDSLTRLDITLKEVILMAQVDNLEFDAPMASFDISFYAADDTEFIEELQPAEWKYVSVTFDYAENNEFKDNKNEWFLAIYHMEDNNDSSIANLVSAKNSEQLNNNTKPDSMSIYANTLSVYILTIVSDLDEEITQDNKTITFDAGSWGFIIDQEYILLSSIETDHNSTYTWKILSKDNSIILPDIQVISWHNFLWWYNWNTYLWNTWTILKLWDSDNSAPDLPNLDYKIYACLYTEDLNWNTCTFNEDKNSDSKTIEESSDNEIAMPNIAEYTPSDEEVRRFGQEVFDAYNRAIKNWITTIDDINKAKLNTDITRAELAKMMVVFMSWVLQKEPIITENANYKDVNVNKLWDLAWYIELAYQYQIMWINADWTPMENFDPNKPVSRWEFATVLSRILFGNTYNQSWDNYYEKHIEALNKANILNDKNPDITERRWWIMTMLYRSQL